MADVVQMVNHQAVEQAAAVFRGSLSELIPVPLTRTASNLGDCRFPAMARMAIAEGQAFPDLARVWHDEVADRVLSLLTGLVAQAQARGEVRAGDPRLHALSTIGPMRAGLLFREVFGSFSRDAPDLEALARQHAEKVLRGLRSNHDRSARPLGALSRQAGSRLI